MAFEAQNQPTRAVDGSCHRELANLLLSQDAAEIETAFRLLAKQSHNEAISKAWARAARAFFQAVSQGRPSIDDAAALDEAESMLVRGVVQTPRAALTRVARRLAKHSNPVSVYERLRRKWVKEKRCHEMLLVAPETADDPTR